MVDEEIIELELTNEEKFAILYSWLFRQTKYPKHKQILASMLVDYSKAVDMFYNREKLIIYEQEVANIQHSVNMALIGAFSYDKNDTHLTNRLKYILWDIELMFMHKNVDITFLESIEQEIVKFLEIKDSDKISDLIIKQLSDLDA